ncbi:MAG: DUF2794 domain-containing protein [Pseudomonadota bacterium]
MAGAPSFSVISGGKTRQSRRAVCFDRRELQAILDIYARMVAFGEWKDYAIDIKSDQSSFHIYRRASEMPAYSIIKQPALARKQGAYRLLSASQQVLRRGHQLAQVLSPLKSQMIKVVESA